MTNVALTLNGGEKELNSATIPVEWWVSEEVIKRDPKYILFFEQNEKEKDQYNDGNRGRRYLCKFSDGIKFLELFSSGYHRLIAVVIAGEEKSCRKLAESFLERRSSSLYEENYKNYYNKSLRWEKEAERVDRVSLFFSNVEELEAPRELFAQKPKTKLGKLIWEWANLFYESPPRDECHYGKRKMIAPFSVLLGYGIIGTIYATYILLASLLVLFAGYRPDPILREMWRAFTLNRDGWEVRKYCWRDDSYRLWSIDKTDKEIRLSVVPWQVTIALVAMAGLYYMVKTWPFSTLSLIGFGIVIIISILIVCLFLSHLKKTKEERRKACEEARKRAAKAAQRWLEENFDLSKKRDKVDPNQLPVPPTLSGRIVQKFRVSYWTLKAKVCKPFDN